VLLLSHIITTTAVTEAIIVGMATTATVVEAMGEISYKATP
jgi:hypothetical protein